MDGVIIYCKRIEDCSDLYCFFKHGLGANFTYPSDAPSELSKYRLVDVFTSVTDQEVKQQVIKSFGNPTAPLRIACATIAFGMGIDTPESSSLMHPRNWKRWQRWEVDSSYTTNCKQIQSVMLKANFKLPK